MLAKLNKLTNWQAVLIIVVVGFVVFSVGLKNPFVGDDTLQIINNPPVHSISNIAEFFEGGTFYSGIPGHKLLGVYYRPLMTTAFSLIYTLFGPHQFFFHFAQLLLCIGSAVILYLFFRYSFKAAVALPLALTFLIHPVNSQVVFAVASMQDALFFFFGILALYLLVRYRSNKSLIVVAACLLLSLLAKETGLLFVGLALLYLFWWNRERLYLFAGTMVLPVALWLVLRAHAIGLTGAQSTNSPIDSLPLAHRLINDPYIVLFYVTKFVFPWKLSSAYFWSFGAIDFRHFVLPLIVDLFVFGLIVYAAIVIRRTSSKAQLYTYLFFTVWFIAGFLPNLQIVPLDFSASEPWFYFSMAGALGMIGTILTSFPKPKEVRLHSPAAAVVCALILVLFGARTVVRGTDWSSAYNLARHDYASSREDYYAIKVIAEHDVANHADRQAVAMGELSISIHPTLSAYKNLGLAQVHLGDYQAAYNAYSDALAIDPNKSSTSYEELGILSLFAGDFHTNQRLLMAATQKYPNDQRLWFCLVALDELNNDKADALSASKYAAENGYASSQLYDYVAASRPFQLALPQLNRQLNVP